VQINIKSHGAFFREEQKINSQTSLGPDISKNKTKKWAASKGDVD
jgi:hypothetical protein